MTTRTAVGTGSPGWELDVRAELRELVAARGALERREAMLVRRARNEGIVWEQIAACLSVSRQAVHKKHAARSLDWSRAPTVPG